VARRPSPYPRTIENGAGEQLTFVGVGSDDQGDYLEARNSVGPGSGPPMHVHHLQEEVLTVERGTMGWQRLGDEEQLATAGESVAFAPGDTHRFWNAGDDELVCSGYVRPPDNVEYFLTKLFESMRANGGNVRACSTPRTFSRATGQRWGWWRYPLRFSVWCSRSWWQSAGFWGLVDRFAWLPSQLDALAGSNHEHRAQ